MTSRITQPSKSSRAWVRLNTAIHKQLKAEIRAERRAKRRAKAR